MHWRVRPATSQRPWTPPCQVEGCEQPSNARGLCGRHYQRWQRSGDPEEGLRVDGAAVAALLSWLRNTHGVSDRWIADQLHMHASQVWAMRTQQRAYVLVRTAQRVRGLVHTVASGREVAA